MSHPNTPATTPVAMKRCRAYQRLCQLNLLRSATAVIWARASERTRMRARFDALLGLACVATVIAVVLSSRVPGSSEPMTLSVAGALWLAVAVNGWRLRRNASSTQFDPASAETKQRLFTDTQHSAACRAYLARVRQSGRSFITNRECELLGQLHLFEVRQQRRCDGWPGRVGQRFGFRRTPEKKAPCE